MSGQVRLTQAQRRERTRDAVLAAAADVFARRGFHAASVDEIGELAGVSKGAIYYSFPSKDELFLALLEQRTAAWVAALNSAPKSEPLEGQASHAISAFFADLDADPSWTPLLLEFLAYSARDERARQLMNERFFDALHTAVATTTAERAAAAGLRDVPVTDFAAGVSALACGLAIEQAFAADRDANRVMTTILGLLLEGLVAQATRDEA